MKKRAGFYIW